MGLLDAISLGISRLTDLHDPPGPKLDVDVLFSYTCRDGSEVPADSFRISSLSVISRAFLRLRAAGPCVEEAFKSMADYVRRSAEKSPRMMREQGDVAAFLSVLAQAVGRNDNLKPALEMFKDDLQSVTQGA